MKFYPIPEVLIRRAPVGLDREEPWWSTRPWKVAHLDRGWLWDDADVLGERPDFDILEALFVKSDCPDPEVRDAQPILGELPVLVGVGSEVVVTRVSAELVRVGDQYAEVQVSRRWRCDPGIFDYGWALLEVSTRYETAVFGAA